MSSQFIRMKQDGPVYFMSRGPNIVYRREEGKVMSQEDRDAEAHVICRVFDKIPPSLLVAADLSVVKDVMNGGAVTVGKLQLLREIREKYAPTR